jgi:hypothetical protein
MHKYEYMSTFCVDGITVCIYKNCDKQQISTNYRWANPRLFVNFSNRLSVQKLTDKHSRNEKKIVFSFFLMLKR